MSPSPISLFRKEIQREKGYHLESYPQVIKLNQNELPHELSPELKDKLLKRLQEIPFNRYPLPQPVELQSRLGQDLGVEAKQLQFSNGSNVMIQALLLATSVQGKVLIVDPTFSVYEIEAKLLGNRVIKVGLNKDFSFPLKKVLAAVKQHRPKIIFLANPNAPTGNLFEPEELLEVVKAAKCLVVVDEAYVQFSQCSLLGELSAHDNLAILRTFSKGFGLGGVRVGYLISHPVVSEQISKVLLPYCLSRISEEVAHFVLDHEDDLNRVIAEVLVEREKMWQAMLKMSSVEVFPSQANFLLFRTRNAQVCFEYLLKKGILVRNVSNKAHLKGCLRVSVGMPEENQAFISALKTF